MTDRPVEPKKESGAVANETVALTAMKELVGLLMDRGMSTFEIADLWRDKIEPGLRDPYEKESRP